MQNRLTEVFKYFSKLGFVAFGGPAAHVAMMQDDLVEKKKWLSSEEFLDYMGATNLIPGPNSTEMTMHCGYHRAGVKGLFVGGMSFIIPAVLITLAVAVFFESISALAWTEPIINGIKAAVISFIVGAVYKLGKKAIKENIHYVIALAVIVASFFGINEIICILGAGLIMLLVRMVYKSGGLACFAYLDGELIDGLGWLTHDDLVEAIAVGQMTPGPVLSTATFIGYKVGGFGGAALASLGIFLPSFFYVWILNNYVHKMRKNKILKSFLEAVNVAAVAVMLVVCIKMGQSILIDWRTTLICAVSFFVFFYYKGINTLWIIIGGGVLGYLLSFI